jgi:hypothetical protein
VGTEVVETADIEAVIEYEMQGSFNFFWEQANTEEGSPGYGLIRDRFPGSPGISSIASVGFGMTAYPIGIEKGYISYEEGQERASKTLDTLLAMERVEGFYFHFVDMQTGERAWESEVSTIDTSILLMGVLTAGEYFGGEVESKAKEIYDGVNWPWFVDDSRNMFHMAPSRSAISRSNSRSKTRATSRISRNGRWEPSRSPRCKFNRCRFVPRRKPPQP